MTTQFRKLRKYLLVKYTRINAVWLVTVLLHQLFLFPWQRKELPRAALLTAEKLETDSCNVAPLTSSCFEFSVFAVFSVQIISHSPADLTTFPAMAGQCGERMAGRHSSFSSFTPVYFYKLFYRHQQINSTPPRSFLCPSSCPLAPSYHWPGHFSACRSERPWRSCSNSSPSCAGTSLIPQAKAMVDNYGYLEDSVEVRNYRSKNSDSQFLVLVRYLWSPVLWSVSAVYSQNI